jgi:hypothetical protein
MSDFVLPLNFISHDAATGSTARLVTCYRERVLKLFSSSAHEPLFSDASDFTGVALGVPAQPARRLWSVVKT